MSSGLPSGIPSENIFSSHLDLEVGAQGGYLEQGDDKTNSPAAAMDPTVKWILRELNAAMPGIEKWRKAAKEKYRFLAGHQLEDNALAFLRQENRPYNAFNTVQKFSRLVSGVERRSPKATVFNARLENDAQRMAQGEFMTKVHEWSREQSKSAPNTSRAFMDLFAAGIGTVVYGASKSYDPKGLPVAVRVSPFDALFPECSEDNFGGVRPYRGTRWRGIETSVDRDEAVARWPKLESMIRVIGDNRELPYRRERIEYVVPWIQTQPINTGGDTTPPGKVKVLEWQWYEDEVGYYFFDPVIKTDQWLEKSEFNAYKRKLDLSGFKIDTYDKLNKRIYKRTFLLDRRIKLQEPERIPGDLFLINVMTGFWDEEKKMWMSFLDMLMDPQRYKNKMHNLFLEIIGTQGKGGLMVEKSAVMPGGLKELQENYSRPGNVTLLEDGAITGKKIQEKTVGQIPPAIYEAMKGSDEQFEVVSGFGPASFGMAAGATPGVTMQQGRQVGLIILAPELDALSWFKKDEGMIFFQIGKLLADDRLIQIGGQDQMEILKLFKVPFTYEYDVTIDEVDRDPNLRELYRDFLLQVAPVLIRTGNFLPEMLDYLPLPVRFRENLKKSMAQKAQQQQQAMMQGLPIPGGRGKQRSLPEIQGDIKKVQSQATLNMAKAEHLIGERNRNDMRAIFESVIEGQKARREKEAHGLAQMQAAIEAARSVILPSGV